MTDTTSCAHHQFFGAREFCPDCGLSRTEVLVKACAPFLKDGETPAECIARNRRDVDGCLTMLIAERRKVEALRSRLAEAEGAIESAGRCLALSNDGPREALLILSAYKRRNREWRADSAFGEGDSRKPIPGYKPGHENCPKCGGDGWLWREELDNPSDWDMTDDDTKYSCDWTPSDQPGEAGK